MDNPSFRPRFNSETTSKSYASQSSQWADSSNEPTESTISTTIDLTTPKFQKYEYKKQFNVSRYYNQKKRPIENFSTSTEVVKNLKIPSYRRNTLKFKTTTKKSTQSDDEIESEIEPLQVKDVKANRNNVFQSRLKYTTSSPKKTIITTKSSRFKNRTNRYSFKGSQRKSDISNGNALKGNENEPITSYKGTTLSEGKNSPDDIPVSI